LAIRIFLNILGCHVSWTRRAALILPAGTAGAHAANHSRL